MKKRHTLSRDMSPAVELVQKKGRKDCGGPSFPLSFLISKEKVLERVKVFNATQHRIKNHTFYIEKGASQLVTRLNPIIKNSKKCQIHGPLSKITELYTPIVSSFPPAYLFQGVWSLG